MRATPRFLEGKRVNDLQDSQRMMREMAQQIRDLIGGRSVLITRRMLELPSQLEQEADVLETEIRASSMKGAADEVA
jgi:phosphoenolpyruvate carboxylase